MGKLPATLFYWGDVQRDPDIRRCTHAEIGVWFRILCLMFEAEAKGMLATNGEPWTDKEIALAIGGDTAETIACVTALVTKGVASRNERGALINRRMYREHLERVGTRERVRLFRERENESSNVTPEETEVKRERTTRAHAETEAEAEAQEALKKKKDAAPEIPDWIPRDTWDAFIQNRKDLRSPMTPRAIGMMIRQLEGFRDSGQDPGAVLEQSIANGWKGVFDIKRGSNGKAGANNQSAAVGRVNRSHAGFGSIADRRITETTGPHAPTDVGSVSPPGSATGNGGSVLHDVRGSGDSVRDEKPRDGPAVVPDSPEILSPSQRSSGGARGNETEK